MKHIALALNAGTPDQRNAITNYFSSQELPFWHWVDDFWIVQVADDVTPKSLHITIEKLENFKTPIILLFEFTGDIKFWGRANKAGWEWLSKIGKAG